MRSSKSYLRGDFYMLDLSGEQLSGAALKNEIRFDWFVDEVIIVFVFFSF